MEHNPANRSAKDDFFAVLNKINKPMILRPVNLTTLARAYRVTPKVLRSRLRPFQSLIGPRQGYKFSLQQLCIILTHCDLALYLGPGSPFHTTDHNK